MTVVYGVWSGEYSDRCLHAIFPTKELAEQYVEDLPESRGFLGSTRDYYVEPEDLYADRAEWIADLQEQRRAAEEWQATITAAEAKRREEAARRAAAAESRAALIASVVGTPHRTTREEIDAEFAAEMADGYDADQDL